MVPCIDDNENSPWLKTTQITCSRTAGSLADNATTEKLINWIARISFLMTVLNGLPLMYANGIHGLQSIVGFNVSRVEKRNLLSRVNNRTSVHVYIF